MGVVTIPTIGFQRGAIVRLRDTDTSWPNMLVVRGLGETTAVVMIEGDDGGGVRLKEFPTANLVQVLGNS